jgi:putative membrane protein
MDAALLDLVLAIVHHFLAFLLAALRAAELVLVRSGLDARGLPLLGRIDGAYGMAAGLLILIGICRVIFGLKGWEFYVYNPVFWMKMAAFAAVGLLSIPPTMRIIRWRRAVPGVVPDAEVTALRNWLKAEAGFFALILIFAAAMARGFGY